jgi:hypothetical protein
MVGSSIAPVSGVDRSIGHGQLEVDISDGTRRGVVSWDRPRCTYRAEIEIFAPPPGVDSPAARTVDAIWHWLSDPEPGPVPGRLVVGHRPIELLTIDAVINRLQALGFRPDRTSLGALTGLRSAVRDRCGSVVFLGRLRPGASGSSRPAVPAEVLLGLPEAEPLPLRPLVDHPAHGFGWGHRGAATIRTAAALVDLAWSTRRDAATEAAVIDLAVTVLAEVRGGFVWRVESVADWLATETGELADEVGRIAGAHERYESPGYLQLCLELR